MLVNSPNTKQFHKFIQIIERNISIGGEILIVGAGDPEFIYNSNLIQVAKNGRSRYYRDTNSGENINLRKMLWRLIQAYPALTITLKKPINRIKQKDNGPEINQIEIRMIHVDMEYDFTWEFISAEIVHQNYQDSNLNNIVFCDQKSKVA